MLLSASIAYIYPVISTHAFWSVRVRSPFVSSAWFRNDVRIFAVQLQGRKWGCEVREAGEGSAITVVAVAVWLFELVRELG